MSSMPATTEPRSDDTPIPGALAVMLVDDDPSLVAAIARMLASLRPMWDVRTATSGMEALCALEERPADVLVSDLAMAGMDGHDLLFIAMGRHPAMARVVLSGMIEGGRMLIESRKWAQLHLLKPCPPAVLAERLEGVVAARRAAASA